MTGTTSSELQVPGYQIDFIAAIRFIYERIFGGDWVAFFAKVEHWWNIYSLIALLVSFLFFVGFVYAKIRYEQLGEYEYEKIKEAEHAWATKHTVVTSKNARWEIIQRRVAENSPESWRVAIIEADILLEETLSNAGYPGATLGEKLKSANSQSFTTIQDAWEAHKVRNEIAHAGSDFILTQRTAQDTILRFERVFREFGVI